MYEITSNFPDSERYGLINQVRRAAISIPSNIAESCRGSNKEMFNFLNIAIGSSFEIETQLIISRNLNYLQEDKFIEIMNKLQVLQKKTNALRNTIKSG